MWKGCTSSPTKSTSCQAPSVTRWGLNFWETLPQDWLTLLGWERPELFHLLPCNFNVQTHEVGYVYKIQSWYWLLNVHNLAVSIVSRATKQLNGPQFGRNTGTAERSQRLFIRTDPSGTQADYIRFWMSPKIVCKHQRVFIRMYLFGTQIDVLQINPKIAYKNQRVRRINLLEMQTDLIANPKILV